MIYVFRCLEHGQFEVSQPMLAEHKANCPNCGQQAERVYLPVTHFWPDVLWHSDGSKQSPDELPPVPHDQNWGWKGFGNGKREEKKE